MKRIIATIGLLCVGLSGAGHETNAQVTINIFNLNDVLRAKPIDETRFTVQYQTTSMPDTLQPDKKEEETLMLKVDIFISVQDSILTSDSRAFYADIFVCNVVADKLFRQSQLHARA